MYASIVNTIESCQSTGNAQYQSGLFPSQRVHTLINYQREDSNIFFSALIVFTLQALRDRLPAEVHPKIESITNQVTSNYPLYQHYADKSTYNFWQRHPTAHFPNGWLLNKMSFLALPADSDDTSLIYLTSPVSDELQTVKRKLEGHYQPDAPLSPLTLKNYSDLSAYPTFLGKKIKREYDVCVMCNILYMVFKFNLKISKVDLDTIEFIRRVLEAQDYRQNPFRISPNYNNNAVILYHIARLVATFEQSELEILKEPLIACLLKEVDRGSNFMECMLLRTSLLRLGIKPPPLSTPADLGKAFSNFYFFQAGMLSGLQKYSLNKLASWRFFHLKYRCEAYYWTLWLEYKVLSGQY
jgi:hypothetical protein